jgi:hypothetical protein
MAKVTIYKGMEGKIARLPVVQAAVVDAGIEIEYKAKRNLAATRDEGRHHIEGGRALNEKYGSLDYWVALVGPAPKSVEFGHFIHNAAWPRYVVGQYILFRAAGLI